jgi:hypothetical protein
MRGTRKRSRSKKRRKKERERTSVAEFRHTDFFFFLAAPLLKSFNQRTAFSTLVRPFSSFRLASYAQHRHGDIYACDDEVRADETPV